MLDLSWTVIKAHGTRDRGLKQWKNIVSVWATNLNHLMIVCLSPNNVHTKTKLLHWLEWPLIFAGAEISLCWVCTWVSHESHGGKYVVSNFCYSGSPR